MVFQAISELSVTKTSEYIAKHISAKKPKLQQNARVIARPQDIPKDQLENSTECYVGRASFRS